MRLYHEGQWDKQADPVWRWVVRDGIKGTQCPGVYLGHPVPGGYKYGDLALQVGGVSRIGMIKYGLESHGTQTQAGLRWRGPAATVNYRPVFSLERTLQNNKPAEAVALQVGGVLNLRQ
jgi:hypothetical protein